ncbi:MAG TPA: metallophosphoesterase [Candidatus Solibacter sp.]|nr:metallophosphoesterase [Candidatus Solibacter sp.]
MALRPITRRKFLRLAATAGAAGLAVDSVLLEPNRPRIVRREISLRRWPAHLDGFTIALLSDFHFDPYFSVHPLESAVGMVNGLQPDVVVLTGDFVSLRLFRRNDEQAAAHAEPCAQILRKMRARQGLWAVMGNHDYFSNPDRVTTALRSAGIQVLANQSTAIEDKGARFWLAGVGDVLGKDADLPATLHNIPDDEATVLLAHEPDYADHAARFPIDLQLSGHSHGGQIRPPFVRPLFLPELARKYIMGLYEVGPLTLYTNPGLGTVVLPIRFNCPPEITLLTMHPATPA